MAFVLISLFDAAGTASADSYREANTLVAIDWAGDSLPEPARGQIHALSQAYAEGGFVRHVVTFGRVLREAGLELRRVAGEKLLA